MKTQDEARKEFANLYEALKDDAKREGYSVNKSAEWERFISHGIEEETLPANANTWRMPRSTK